MPLNAKYYIILYMENNPEKIDLVIDYVSHIIKGIVRNPDDVEVHTKDIQYNNDHGTYTITNVNVRVHDDDIKFVLGKGGKVAEWIRGLVHIFGINCEYPNRIAFRVDTPPMPKNHFYPNHENG